MKIRSLVAEDEPLARQKLHRLLKAMETVEIVGTSSDGPSTVLAIDDLQPDLVFLDIQLPGLTGLEVLQRIVHRPHVIFTTAYDRYAVTAFELHAIDYLLKPFGRERLGIAVDRAREMLTRGLEPGTHDRASQAFDADVPLGRLFVRTRGHVVLVRTETIEHIEGEGDYVRLHVAGAEHLVHVRLKDLEARLDSQHFLRIHKSHLINLRFVDALTPHEGSRYLITLRSGRQVVASRRRSKDLRRQVI